MNQDQLLRDLADDFGFESTKTNAERFAELLNDDGQCWETADGVRFDELAESFKCERVYGVEDGLDEGEPRYRECASMEQFSGDPVRYIFPDGSVIVTRGEAWDLEGDAPFTWKG